MTRVRAMRRTLVKTTLAALAFATVGPAPLAKAQTSKGVRTTQKAAPAKTAEVAFPRVLSFDELMLLKPDQRDYYIEGLREMIVELSKTGNPRFRTFVEYEPDVLERTSRHFASADFALTTMVPKADAAGENSCTGHFRLKTQNGVSFCATASSGRTCYDIHKGVRAYVKASSAIKDAFSGYWCVQANHYDAKTMGLENVELAKKNLQGSRIDQPLAVAPNDQAKPRANPPPSVAPDVPVPAAKPIAGGAGVVPADGGTAANVRGGAGVTGTNDSNNPGSNVGVPAFAPPQPIGPVAQPQNRPAQAAPARSVTVGGQAPGTAPANGSAFGPGGVPAAYDPDAPMKDNETGGKTDREPGQDFNSRWGDTPANGDTAKSCTAKKECPAGYTSACQSDTAYCMIDKAADKLGPDECKDGVMATVTTQAGSTSPRCVLAADYNEKFMKPANEDAARKIGARGAQPTTSAAAEDECARPKLNCADVKKDSKSYKDAYQNIQKKQFNSCVYAGNVSKYQEKKNEQGAKFLDINDGKCVGPTSETFGDVKVTCSKRGEVLCNPMLFDVSSWKGKNAAQGRCVPKSASVTNDCHIAYQGWQKEYRARGGKGHEYFWNKSVPLKEAYNKFAESLNSLCKDADFRVVGCSECETMSKYLARRNAAVKSCADPKKPAIKTPAQLPGAVKSGGVQ